MFIDTRLVVNEKSSSLVRLIAAGGLYFMLGLMLKAAFQEVFVNPLWPLSGFALSLIFLYGYQYAILIFIATFLLQVLTSDGPSWLALCVALSLSLEAIISNKLFKWFACLNNPWRYLYDYGFFILISALIACALSAAIACSLGLIAGQLTSDNFAASITQWWLGDVLGILLISPVALVCLNSTKVQAHRLISWEFCLLLIATLITGAIIYDSWLAAYLGMVASSYWIFLLITWSAARFGLPGLAIILILTAFHAIWRVKNGSNYFGPVQSWGAYLNCWFYIVSLSIVGNVLATFFNERNRSGEELQIAAVAFEAQHGMIITDVKGIIIRVNNTFMAVTGYSQVEVVGRSLQSLNSERHDFDFYQEMWNSVLSIGRWQGELWIKYQDASIHPQWFTFSEVKNDWGAVTHFVGSLLDIEHRKAAEEEIYQLAFYDPLTNLANRRLLLERLKYDIEVVRREGKQLALMMLDLDRFKLVNDSLGHTAGDELLTLVSKRLTGRLRDVDMVARLGGDEFVVLLSNISMPEDAARVADAIVKDISRPFKLSQSDDVRIGVSIGISLFPQHGSSPETLLEQADIALYQAKNEGRGCFAYYNEKFTQAVRERIELENRLRLALDRNELSVVYQPQVDISSGQIVGAQMLVRWNDPLEGLISPSRFIPVAEESGLIGRIGEWVLREGCRQASAWMAAGYSPLRLSVKLSAYQIHHGDINAVVTDALTESAFPAELLELELSESSLIEHDGSAEVLQRIRMQGVQLVIDDFGNGNSSLTYLKRFPLDVVKIGKVFIQEKDDMDIAATIVAMAQALGMKTLAEGVETSEQLNFLESKGCDTYQGYFKSRPVSALEFEKLLNKPIPI